MVIYLQTCVRSQTKRVSSVGINCRDFLILCSDPDVVSDVAGSRGVFGGLKLLLAVAAF